MQHAQLVERVREIVKTAFTERGVSSFEDLCETILVRDGFYCGRCFTLGDLRAVWFLEENVIKFFCRDAGMFRTCSPEPTVAAPRSLVA